MAFVGKNHPSIQEAFQRFFETKNIEEQCTEQSLICLHNAFLATENGEMNSSQLYDAFRDILEIRMSRDEFQVFSKKIDTRLDDRITWDEFISYLLIEFRDIDTSLRSQMLEMPLTDLPKLLRTRHRTPVCRITFCPEVLPDRSTSFRRGCYLTVSREGVINYWSLDLEYERTVQSKNPYLKVQSTAITDMIVLPDVQIVCTSSTECDLRFYDVAVKKFDLRILISSLENAVVCMHYYFSTNANENSYVILGDTSGSVTIMAFNPADRGPFKQHTACDTILLRYDNVIKVTQGLPGYRIGELQGFDVTVFRNIHTNWTSQVAYYESLRTFVSSSQCSDCSLCVFDASGARTQYKFQVPMGISCFTLCDENRVLVTGGPDCVVRVWNPFVPGKANAVLSGHRSTICALVVIDAGKRIYSVSKDRCIKVWDVPALSCIQTYNKLSSELSEYAPVTVAFNTLTRTMIIASTMIAVLVCERVINKETSDGYTHTKGVSCVLYNQLFQVIVSAGLDSCIIVWDPWRGRRLRLISHAHSIMRYGQHVDVEITAACFDNSEQFLVTGARDGSLKVWNYNTGVCVRDVMVDHQCEITGVAWHENRILCCGWNKHVTELAAFESDVCRKSWTTSHTDDILCSAAKLPQLLATGTYNGELILWRLETGQPFRKYQVIDVSKRHLTPCAHQESALNVVRVTAVRAIIFLAAREAKPNVGTLVVALDSGLVQVWTHHPAAGFLAAFSAVHATGDCATSLATDSENQFLVTGLGTCQRLDSSIVKLFATKYHNFFIRLSATLPLGLFSQGHSVGYMKVWLLSNYMLPNPPKICMPLLRLEFPFLWKDKIDGRAKRAVRDQPLPLLLSSVRGHTRGITTLQVISSARMIVRYTGSLTDNSGSADRTVRMWSFGGRYISTLGTFRDCATILPTVPVQRYFEDYKLPADIRGHASFTTLKVLHGGMRRGPVEIEEEETDIPKEILEEERHMLYGKDLDGVTLENYYKSQLPKRTYQKRLRLDNTLPYIPIYAHLPIYSLKPVEAQKTLLLGQKMELAKKVYLRRATKPLRSSVTERAKGTFTRSNLPQR
ncbi:PREDICTED: WD repeat-containing protein on Y chromosome-like [Vollenhovia emeryi]|uniref:WD repeat-containing protein on Y chromosome-like n=1 Tax=Vollenhovia emeryi TaxID=411798 RepID=UPI0005F4067E|nr:PREDICTED: WD repeat-containing protein on Y chromosome-like [Vollenhovia emeryi]